MIAAAASGAAIYWDVNFGPSQAFSSQYGKFASETFTLSVPESSTLATLLDFGIFNLAAVFGVRRKLI